VEQGDLAVFRFPAVRGSHGAPPRYSQVGFLLGDDMIKTIDDLKSWMIIYMLSIGPLPEDDQVAASVAAAMAEGQFQAMAALSDALIPVMDIKKNGKTS
jgi:hypothetical protein